MQVRIDKPRGNVRAVKVDFLLAVVSPDAHDYSVRNRYVALFDFADKYVHGFAVFENQIRFFSVRALFDMFIHFPLTCLLDFLFIFVLSFYIRRDGFPLNTKKRKGTFRSLCASGRIVFHFHGRIPPCLADVETILSQNNLFIKSSCALLRPVFRQTKTVRLFLFFACGHFGEPGFTPQAVRCTASFS